MSKLTSETFDAYGDAVSAAALARGTSRYDDAVANAAGARNAVIAEIERLRQQRDELLEALGPDSADVPFAELLRDAARRIVEIGDGPLADRLLRKAEQVEAVTARCGPCGHKWIGAAAWIADGDIPQRTARAEGRADG